MTETDTNDHLSQGTDSKLSDAATRDEKTSLNTSGIVSAESSTPRTTTGERDLREAVFADKLVIRLALILLICIFVAVILSIINSTTNNTFAQKIVFGIIALLATGALILWKVPKYQVSALENLAGDIRFTLENEARRTLAQILAGILLLAGVYGTLKTVQVSEGEHLADRFSKGIERVDSETRGVRIAGIYALVSLAKEADNYKPDIQDVFLGFIRDKATYTELQATPMVETEPSPTSNIGLTANVSDKTHGINDLGAEQYTREIELIVGFFSHPDNRAQGLDFRQTYLKDLKCSDCNFTGWDFSNARLDGVRFISSSCIRAVFKSANLKDVDFTGTDLSNADFDNAELSNVNLERTNLKDANFSTAEGLTFSQIKKSLNYRSATFSEAIMSEIKAEDLAIEEWKKRQPPP